jgi:hypothetical protein
MSHKKKNKNQTKTSKKRTQCALDTTIRKQTQITLIRHEPSYKELEVKNEPTIVWRKHIFDIYVTEYGTALTTILPILVLYLNTVIVTAGTFERNESGRFGALKSDSTHHFFRNACTKSGSLRFSQISGC